MPDFDKWLGSRLKRIEASDFQSVSHRSLPEFIKKLATPGHFSIPLGSGVGQALLLTPKSEIDRKPAFVVLLHGLGDDCTFPLWHWMDAFLKEGITVLSSDWDGHGSRGGSYFDFQTATRTVPLLLQKLFSGNSVENSVECPVDGCFLVGHSAGAALALIAATRSDSASFIKGVAAVSPTVSLASPALMKKENMQYLSPRAWVSEFLPKTSLYGLRNVFSSFGPSRRDARPLRLHMGIEWRHQMSVFLEDVFEKKRLLRQVKSPVLWLHGSKDRVVPYEKAMELISEVPSALFSHTDSKKGHLRMAFSNQSSNYISNFIKTCAGI